MHPSRTTSSSSFPRSSSDRTPALSEHRDRHDPRNGPHQPDDCRNPRRACGKRAFSATELTKAYLAAIEAARALNAYIVETPEKALAMAAASDDRLAQGHEPRALEGVPLGIKDLFATEGVHTQAASHVLDGFLPPYESTVTANLWRDGAVMLGKLNMDEFAMGSSNETSYLRPGRQSLEASEGSNPAARPRRFVRRLGGSRGGAPLRRRDGDGHGRLDPPAGRLHRHGRHQADLWPLLALGHRSPSPPRSTRPVRSPEPCVTPRSCSSPWPPSTTRTRRRSTCR